MGNHPSAHQPLERGTSRRHSFRFSKKERSPNKRMDRIRRSFRDSFRRRRDPNSPEVNKFHQWQSDESAVRTGTCAFHVKYLGCVEVYEQRGMQVCEEALRVLRNSKRRPVRAILHVSGDGIRVVEDETKGLIVDQTIEKVSFCAPDRNHEKGFSYICRDGTTRRWMCHGFLATKESDSGERLSHAVGCAFAACLEKKQRRNEECGVTMTFDQQTSIFTRTGSFRQTTFTERLQDSRERAIDVPAARQVFNPYAIERPHATPSMLERQGSFRGFNQLNQASPFKRQLSLRVNDLPSNFERVRSHSLEPTDLSRLPLTLPHKIPAKPPEFKGFDEVSPIPEISPSSHDNVSAMCQQISRGLKLLTSTDDFVPVVNTTTRTIVNKLSNDSNTTSTIPGVINSTSLDDLQLQNGQSFGDLFSSNNNKNNTNNNNIDESNNPLNSDGMSWQDSSSSAVSSTINHRLTPILNQCSLSPVLPRSSVNSTPALMNPIASVFETPAASPAFSTASTSSLSSNAAAVNQFMNRSPVPLPPSARAILGDSPNNSLTSASPPPVTAPAPIAPLVAAVAPTVSTNTEIASSTTQSVPVTAAQPVPNATNLPKPDQWLGSVTTHATEPPPVAPRRNIPMLHSRAMSVDSAAMSTKTGDPFDAEWAEVTARNLSQASTTNPFIVPFQVQL